MDSPNDNVIVEPYPVPSDRIWFDPRLIVAATQYQLTTFTFAIGGTKVIIPANTRRWAIGFFQPVAVVAMTLSPWPDNPGFVFTNMSATSFRQWFTLFDYGSLICNSWTATANAAASLRIVELLRN